METKVWIPMIYLDFKSQHDRYICDTRDFHVSAWPREDASFDPLDDYIQDWIKNASYIINIEEIPSFLDAVKTWKNLNKQIIFKVEQNEFKGWLKYIRFKKISENKYITYTTVGNTYYPIDWNHVLNDAKV